MTGTWLRGPGPDGHHCELPEPARAEKRSVWRCGCGRRWTIRDHWDGARYQHVWRRRRLPWPRTTAEERRQAAERARGGPYSSPPTANEPPPPPGVGGSIPFGRTLNSFRTSINPDQPPPERDPALPEFGSPRDRPAAFLDRDE